MDPLSISVSIIAIVGAIRSTIDTAKSVFNAPEELESLLNDLTESEIMILDVKHHLGQPRPEHLPELNLQERLGEAECVLLDLKNLVQAILLKSQDSTSIRRYAWFKAKKKIRKLRNKLAQIHEELPRRLGQVEGSRIKLELTNMFLVQEQIHTGLSRVETTGDATSQRVSNMLEAQGQHTEALHLLQQLQQRANSSIEEIRGDTLHRLDRIESAVSVTNTPRTASRIPRLSIQGDQQPSDSFEPASPHSFSHTMHPATDFNSSNLRSTYHSLTVQTQYRTPNACPSACRCRCHMKQTMRTPSFLSGLIGQIFVGYKGMPTIAKSCTQTDCRRTSNLSIYATYFFPSWWIVNRMMLIVARRRANLGPELILRFPSYVPPQSEVADAIPKGRIDVLKELFACGKASPNDVIAIEGSTSLLRYALRHRQFPIMKHLVQAGADLDVEDPDGRTISDSVCELLFTRDCPKDHEQWLSATFTSSSQLQNLEFSGLHEIILGLKFAKIQDEIFSLRSAGSKIDVQDSWGNTPLHWACARGDKEAVYQLLGFGADPNIINNLKQSPLVKALRLGNLECAFDLLNHGADPNFSFGRGWTTFHAVALYCRNHPYIVDFLDKLYELGVDINARNPLGSSGLICAIQVNNYRATRWFLKRGADYKIAGISGGTLHYAGFYGNLKTIEIIREFQLSGIDIHSKDNLDGRTAMDEILDPNRMSVASDELIASFTRLLSEIEARTNGRAAGFDGINNQNPAEPETMSLVPDTVVESAQPVEEIADPCTEYSEDDEDEVFVDSVEMQPEDPMKLGEKLVERDPYVENGGIIDRIGWE